MNSTSTTSRHFSDAALQSAQASSLVGTVVVALISPLEQAQAQSFPSVDGPQIVDMEARAVRLSSSSEPFTPS